MSKIDDLIESLCMYENGDLDDVGKSYLKDELLDVSEKLHNEDIREGWKYEGMMLLIEKGSELPQPHKEMTFKSDLTDEPMKIKIKEITGLRQNDNGNLIVEVLAKKIKS